MLYSISLRPKKFSEVFGQPNVIKELEKRKISKNWPSAILLKGQTGVGKTTVGQIIAMTINCTNPDSNLDPCGKCASCLSIIEERFDRNTVRIDGGQTSKGEVIDFLDGVSIAPMYDKNNIIIIEESDQLSKAAKSSLLKTLERPQPNITFILLSMFNTGLPPEIQSRCQVYNLKSFTNSDIMYALKGSMEKLNLWDSELIPKSFKLEGLRAIAESASGSLRSALQCLEKCIIGEYWTVKDIEDNLGIIDYTKATNLIQLLLDVNPKFFVDFEGVDIQEFFNYTYTILSSTYAHVVSNYVNVREEFEANTRALGSNINLTKLIKVYDEIYVASNFLKKSFLLSKFSQYYNENKVEKKGRKFIE